jgi:hypothetical protein
MYFMSNSTFVGKCLTGSVCLSLMASTTVKMAGSECASKEKQEQRKLRRDNTECACEDFAEAQKSKNPLGIRK